MSGDADDQDRVAAFLTGELSGPDGPPETVETHISKVFLAGRRALKMKRAVRFPFLDFRTLEARREACADEVRLNRRTAPDIYKGVLAVTEADDGSLALGGDGRAVEYLVDMVRFDEATLFDRLAGVPGALRRRTIEALADEIARFHADAEPVRDRGGHAGIRMIAENNAQSFAALADGTFDADRVRRAVEDSLARIDAARELLDARRAQGRVRRCHGDLHLRNICLVDGRPTLFDAIEFSADFSEIDVMYDLAFLLMDLEHRGHRRLASFLLNRYLEVADETPDVFRVLPIFLGMRAQIRAHVGGAIAPRQKTDAARTAARDEARAYLDLALAYTRPAPPRLVAVGGLSGSGKSRLARELAPWLGAAPGACVVRTDVIRKRLAGVHPDHRLGPDGYSAEMTARTYAAFADVARDALAAGQAVVMDAVFAGPAQRLAAKAIADGAGVPFDGIWVAAPLETRLERVGARTGGVSDATPDVARMQEDYDLGDITWAVIDSSGPKDRTVAAGMRALGLAPEA